MQLHLVSMDTIFSCGPWLLHAKWTAFIRCFCSQWALKVLNSIAEHSHIHAHIHTPMAVSTMQGNSQLQSYLPHLEFAKVNHRTLHGNPSCKHQTVIQYISSFLNFLLCINIWILYCVCILSIYLFKKTYFCFLVLLLRHCPALCYPVGRIKFNASI